MNWTTALPDWESRIIARQSLIPCQPLFPDQAEKALKIFKGLRIVDAPGSPTMGQACRPWVFDFVAAIFGAYDAEAGRRLMNEFFMLISKKNSKSTIAAGIMITALVLNWRNSAELIILAPTIEIAGNSAKPATDMVMADPELRDMLRPIPHLRMIEHRTTGATLKIIAADSEVVSGKKAGIVLIDELWLFGKKAGAEDMLREALGGLASRPEGFVLALTTQSNEPPAGVFRDWLNRFRGIRDGRIIAPRSLGVLYEFPDAMLASGAFRDPANFYITNPNLGASVDEQFLTDEFQKANDKGIASLAGFAAKHLNVEVGIGLKTDRWRGADHWEAATDPSLSLEEIKRRCDVIVAGIDGGGLDDLLGLGILGRDRETRDWLHWGRAWCHDTVLALRKSEASKFRDYEAAGDLVIVNDLEIAFAEAAEIVAEIHMLGLLAKVGLDPMGVGALVDALAERDVQGDGLVVGISQGWTLNGAIKTAETKLASGTLRHCGQGIMAYAVGNAKAEPKGNAITITKQVAGAGKIDPLMALLNTVVLMSRNPEPSLANIEQGFALL